MSSETEPAWGTRSKRQRSCGTKVRFTSRQEAKRAIKKACLRNRESQSDWEYYRCRYCTMLHIGHVVQQRSAVATVADAVARARDRYPLVALGPAVDGPVADLSVYDPGWQRRWAARCQAALKSLHAYVAAKRGFDRPFSGNFHTFCQFTAAGEVPVGSIKLRESPALMGNERLAAQRVFAVDTALDPSGRCAMESHLYLQQQGNPAPRMYFFDDSRGATGLVHVGYIGKHLDTTFTARRM